MNYKKYRKRIAAWLGTVMLAGSLTACGTGSGERNAEGLQNVENGQEAKTESETVTSDDGEIAKNKLNQDNIFSDKDKEIGYDESSCVSISLKDSATAFVGKGVNVDGDIITIKEKGTYILSGSLSNGQIIVDAGKEKVRLIFNGITVHKDNSAAVYIRQADKVFVTLARGTKNYLSNQEEFVAIDDNSIDGVMFSKDDLTLNGEGRLEIKALCGNGIVSKDDLRITSGSYTVEAAGHALEGKDSVAIADGEFALTAGKDGIHSENKEDNGKGFIFIGDGELAITAEGDGMDASGILQVDGGNISIKAGGGSADVSYAGGQEGFPQEFNGKFPGMPNGAPPEMPDGEMPEELKGNMPERPDGEMPEELEGNMPERPNGAPPEESNGVPPSAGEMAKDASGDTAGEDMVSTRGLKSDYMVFLEGGTIAIDAADDTVHSNGSVQVDGGSLNLASGDDAVHAGEALVVNGGNLCVAKCYEGLEGMTVTINGGTMDITSFDDGFNAAGGADQSGSDGGWGEAVAGASEDCWIEINDGFIKVDASGDGMDSNGNLFIHGGEIYVSGAENDWNGALDYGEGAKAVITGGTLAAAGFSGMAENFDSSSTQGIMLVQLKQICTGGEVSLAEESGKELVTFAPGKSYNSVYISCPQLQKGKTYTLTAQGNAQTVEMTDLNYSNVQGRGDFRGRW